MRTATSRNIKLDKGFVDRSLKAALIVTFIFSPFIFVKLGPSIFLGFFAGAIWNIINVFLISKMVSLFLFHNKFKGNKLLSTIAFLIKFPLLYGGGFWLIAYLHPSIYGVLAGFSIILIVFILKLAGIYMANYTWKEEKSGSYGRSS